MAARPPTSPTAPRVVLGTTQQDGAPAKLGETFTLGKASPLNFTLLKAEYSVGRVVIGNTVYYPQVGEKLLVLHYTVHNPQKKDVRYSWADLKFAAVDAQDRTHEFVQAVAREGTTERLELSLKPAQKVQAMTVIRVPASGVVPKLMVQREAALLRYDLRGQVTPLAKGTADPADISGATPRSQVPTALKTFSSLERFDVRLDEVGFTKPPRRWVMVTPRGVSPCAATPRLQRRISSPYRWSMQSSMLAKYRRSPSVPSLREARQEGPVGRFPDSCQMRRTYTRPGDGGGTAGGSSGFWDITAPCRAR
ncbi:hypothetical protein DAERI_070067 [Deinococcus aerius]|uniref:DUF4352 domain-containing protein n=1 Tax=Deinococcus aerius TaxID=200253 RepID=A0A2I9CVS9_9DEIO|nr:hypothetical protein [Deinococcus aerius]GBF06069.1 hypothetical protein DAERI_070067 [Deinococcus aerius]